MTQHVPPHHMLHQQLTHAMKLRVAPIADRFALMRYTDHSKATGEATSTRLNRALARGEPIHPLDRDMHEAIHAHAKPTGHHYSVYSGTRIDAAQEHKPGTQFEAKAHMSTTHDMHIAIDHAIKRRKTDVAHINHIAVKPDTSVMYLGGVSKHPMEYETVIPHKTKLTYTHTTHHVDEDNNRVDIHHFLV